MLGHDNLYTQFTGAFDDRIEVVYLEPQQDAVSVRLVITIADRTVLVFYFEAVQLKDKLAIRNQLLVFGAPMIALAAQQTLIPPATCFHISYGDEGLRAHANQRNNSLLTRLGSGTADVEAPNQCFRNGDRLLSGRCVRSFTVAAPFQRFALTSGSAGRYQ